MQLTRNHIISRLLAILTMTGIYSIAKAQYVIHGKNVLDKDSLINIPGARPANEARVNSISVWGNISRPMGYPGQQIPQPWEKMEPLVTSFQGKKIKKMLVQHASGKVDVFLKGNTVVSISEDAAQRAGLLPAKAGNAAEIIRVDSPLYVGDRIIIHITKQDPGNTLNAIAALISPGDTTGAYILQCNSPRDIYIQETAADGRVKKVYQYHVVWPPGQFITEAPDFFPGIISSVVTDYNLFKKQDSIIVTNGYRFSGATVYFSGAGFANVFVNSINTGSLAAIKGLAGLCLPGSVITFDNVSVQDVSGKKTVITGKSYKLIDSTDIRDDYSSLVMYPDFPGGADALNAYLAEKLAGLTPGSIEKGKTDLFFSFIVEPDGSLRDVFEKDLFQKSSTQQICYDLLKQYHGWIPGTYKGQKTAMISSMNFIIEIK